MTAIPTLSELNYGPLFEPEDADENIADSWKKDTVQWAMEPKNKGMLYSYWRNLTKGAPLLSTDCSNLHNELLLRLRGIPDYDLWTAQVKSKSGSPIPITGYVIAQARYIYLQEMTKEKKIQSKQIAVTHPYEHSKEDEVDIFSLVQDDSESKRYDAVLYDLEDVLGAAVFNRYAYGRGIDIFELIYFKLKGATEELIQKYFTLKGATPQDLKHLRQKNIVLDGENLLVSIIKAITYLNNTEKAIAIVRQYLFCADCIDNLLAKTT